MLNIVLFGPPGAGKGTQAEKLIKKYQLVHLSTGDILRDAIAKKTTYGIEAKKFIDKGELVTDDIVIGMIEQKLDENPSALGFIFDGFPRTTSQAGALSDMLKKKGVSISVMLSLEAKREELVKRLLNRGKISGRSDDQDISVIENRIDVYHEKTAQVIDFYKAIGKYRPVNGIGEIDEIFKNLCTVIDEYR